MPSLTNSTDNLERALMEDPSGCGYDRCIDQVEPMTDPKNSEAQSEELHLQQLEEAAGAVIHPSFMTDPNKIVDPLWQAGPHDNFRKIVDPTKPERSRRADTNNLRSDNRF